jgi:hypothetical protein
VQALGAECLAERWRGVLNAQAMLLKAGAHAGTVISASRVQAKGTSKNGNGHGEHQFGLHGGDFLS